MRSTAPEVVEELESCGAPMRRGCTFLCLFANVLLIGPKSPPPTTHIPAARWNFVKLVEVAA